MVTTTGRWVHREKTISSVLAPAHVRAAHRYSLVGEPRSEQLGRGLSTVCVGRLSIRCSGEGKLVRISWHRNAAEGTT